MGTEAKHTPTHAPTEKVHAKPPTARRQAQRRGGIPRTEKHFKVKMMA